MNLENKYHFAREVMFNLRSCKAITENVYLHWIDKLIKDETEALRIRLRVYFRFACRNFELCTNA